MLIICIEQELHENVINFRTNINMSGTTVVSGKSPHAKYKKDVY